MTPQTYIETVFPLASRGTKRSFFRVCVLCRNIGCASRRSSSSAAAEEAASAAEETETAQTVNRRDRDPAACASDRGAPCGFAARAVPGARLEVRDERAETCERASVDARRSVALSVRRARERRRGRARSIVRARGRGVERQMRSTYLSPPSLA